MRHPNREEVVTDMVANRKTCAQVPEVPGGAGAESRGFSLVDLLVSIAVMSLLVALLLPSLVSANEVARRAKCASNVRQLGLGLQMFAYDHGDEVPSSTFPAFAQNHDAGGQQDTIYVRLDPQDFEGSRQFTDVRWDGLGLLAKLNYADAPNVYYCPSHTGEHPYSRYAETWLSSVGTIADNYQYRTTVSGSRLGNLKPWTSLIADGMRTPEDYNHRVGNNLLRADLSVQWFADVGGTVLGILSRGSANSPSTSQQVNRAWDELDRNGSTAPGTNSTNQQ